MHRNVFSRLFPVWLAICATSHAAVVRGKILDQTGSGIPGARIQVIGAIGPVSETTSDPRGAFVIDLGTRTVDMLSISAPGFARREVKAIENVEVTLEIAPIADAITVSGSALPAPLSEQATSVSIIRRTEIAGRNEALALDLLRGIPGVIVAQTGQRGGTTSLFIRGGDSKFNLVLIDGVPVNDMRLGGFFDFAHIPTDYLESIEVIRGPQSATYGSYANSSVINFRTRLEDAAPTFGVLAEGGTFATRRFAVNGAGSARGWRGSLTASRLDTDGEVDNNDYRNENVSLGAGKRFGLHDISFRGAFNSSENGVPGPYGSNPVGNYSGLDRVSRNWNNFADYVVRYSAEINPRIRQEIYGTYFQNNNAYRSAFGWSYNKDRRGTGEARTTIAVNDRYTVAFGYVFAREGVRNTFITDANGRQFFMERDEHGLYVENRFRLGTRLFLNAGLRTEIIDTPALPLFTPFAEHRLARTNPKIGAAYHLTASTRAHASFGTGLRPPGGFDLAFTNNPALKPERTRSFDAGFEQRLGRRVSLDATYFYNRYYDLIVSLGGSLARLGSYRTDNLANSRAQGAEFSLNYRPSSKMAMTGNYTFLDSEILSLDRASGIAPQFFHVGQQLLRRPRHSGSITSSFQHRRMALNLIGVLRGAVLDTEPSFGASSGFFRNSGYANVGLNLNYDLGKGVTMYGNLRNALNRKYEEIYGYPSPRLNFIAGLKWTFTRER